MELRTHRGINGAGDSWRDERRKYKYLSDRRLTDSAHPDNDPLTNLVLPPPSLLDLTHPHIHT